MSPLSLGWPCGQAERSLQMRPNTLRHQALPLAHHRAVDAGDVGMPEAAEHPQPVADLFALAPDDPAPLAERDLHGHGHAAEGAAPHGAEAALAQDAAGASAAPPSR